MAREVIDVFEIGGPYDATARAAQILRRRWSGGSRALLDPPLVRVSLRAEVSCRSEAARAWEGPLVDLIVGVAVKLEGRPWIPARAIRRLEVLDG